MDLSGPNDQRVITRDHVNRFRRTLDAIEAEHDGGCNCGAPILLQICSAYSLILLLL